MKTFSVKPKQITRRWFVLDASQAPLGRVSTAAARLLLGKDKPTQSPHIDGGDYVVIINSKSVVTTGKKVSDKIYYRHSGFPGGISSKNLADLLKQNPEKIIRHAIRGMLPDNKLRKARLARLKIYPGAEHAHQAHNPSEVTITIKEGK